ncbi:unnamed protein product [Trichobilharzia regenti]|nr:unnamed protein product [Trichobilharzia regenti]
MNIGPISGLQIMDNEWPALGELKLDSIGSKRVTSRDPLPEDNDNIDRDDLKTVNKIRRSCELSSQDAPGTTIKTQRTQFNSRWCLYSQAVDGVAVSVSGASTGNCDSQKLDIGELGDSSSQKHDMVSDCKNDIDWLRVERRQRNRNKALSSHPTNASVTSHRQRNESSCSELSDVDEDELLNYLIVIVPERAGGRAHDQNTVASKVHSAKSSRSSESWSEKTDSECSHVSAAPNSSSTIDKNQSSHGGYSCSEHSAISSRLLARHPGGDRHPNPDYQSRAKINADMLQRIRLGLEDYEQNVKRERYNSICELGFEDDVGENSPLELSSESSNHSVNRLEKVWLLFCLAYKLIFQH